MADRITSQRRSWLMSRIKGKDTAPEIRVRKAAYRLGLRFRLHRRDLPGSPDIVFASRRIVLFVHGCYWHRHRGCSKATAPASAFWADKFEKNVKRDKRVTAELKRLGWRVFVIWECDTKVPRRLENRLKKRILKAPRIIGDIHWKQKGR